MAGIEYRPLADSDFAGVHRVALESWRNTYRGLLDEERIEGTVNEHYSAERLRQVLGKVATGSRYFEVAVRDGQVLGFCTIVFTSLGAELSRLYVLPGAFDGRVGSTLLQRATQYLRSHGYHSCHSWMHKGNQRAIQMYLRRGARHVPELDRDDSYYVERALTVRGSITNAVKRVLRRLARTLRGGRQDTARQQ
ncbi:MAG TPA: GNAT family N-acetyltransferase [Steroidobacteraceae bacterium]|nr:GNAT family N-acetyltransferase [Steroidobacteraceae bacterium]